MVRQGRRRRICRGRAVTRSRRAATSGAARSGMCTARLCGHGGRTQDRHCAAAAASTRGGKRRRQRTQWNWSLAFLRRFTSRFSAGCLWLSNMRAASASPASSASASSARACAGAVEGPSRRGGGGGGGGGGGVLVGQRGRCRRICRPPAGLLHRWGPLQGRRMPERRGRLVGTRFGVLSLMAA